MAASCTGGPPCAHRPPLLQRARASASPVGPARRTGGARSAVPLRYDPRSEAMEARGIALHATRASATDGGGCDSKGVSLAQPT